MVYSRIGVVTGANRGIGFAIVRQLALQYPQSPMNNGPLLIYLCARDQSKGEAALDSIKNDDSLKRASALISQKGLSEVKTHPLDISEEESITSFASFLKSEHPEGIDFVINNAAIALDGFHADMVRKTLACNYYGTLAATRALLPLIRPGGRLVNVTSMSGHLNKYSEQLQKRFTSATRVDDISTLMEEFHAAVADGTHAEKGWPTNSYSVSKAGATGMTLVIAKEEDQSGRDVLVNACCPGWVQTDMTKGRGHKTADEGAQTPVMLAIADIGQKSGLFWQHEKPIEW